MPIGRATFTATAPCTLAQSEDRAVMWWTWLKIFCLFTTGLGAAEAITIDKCKLIDVFREEFAPDLVDDWVCLARWESHYNTSAIGTLNWDGSKDLGLFQISEKWWCEWGSKGKGCRMDCEGKVRHTARAQGWAKKWSPGLVNFVLVAYQYHFCRASASTSLKNSRNLGPTV